MSRLLYPWSLSPSVPNSPISLGTIVAIASHLINQAMHLNIKKKEMSKLKPDPEIPFICLNPNPQDSSVILVKHFYEIRGMNGSYRLIFLQIGQIFVPGYNAVGVSRNGT